MDGVGDNADAFPDDPNETTDSDMDGVGDNADAFPDDDTNGAGTDNNEKSGFFKSRQTTISAFATVLLALSILILNRFRERTP